MEVFHNYIQKLPVSLFASIAILIYLILFLPDNPIKFNAVGGSNTSEKVVALSFDDGPSAKNTREILAILKQYNAKATFFVCGGNVKLHPDVLREEFGNGNEIGSHSYTHPMMNKLSEDSIRRELVKANDEIYKVINVRPVLFRPPYGASSERVRSVVNQLGMREVTWSFLVNDWDVNKTTSEKIADQIIRHAQSGAILAMHDGYIHREKTVQALPIILSELQKQGYQFVTVSELLKIKSYR
jgi:peptidoglycan-N-acetylglucosamine deacetylase